MKNLEKKAEGNTDSQHEHEGFKLIGSHRDGCRALKNKDGMMFIITDHDRPFDFSRRRDGQRGGSTMWWRFCCNDISCPAHLLVRWDVMAKFVNRTDDA